MMPHFLVPKIYLVSGPESFDAEQTEKPLRCLFFLGCHEIRNELFTAPALLLDRSAREALIE